MTHSLVAVGTYALLLAWNEYLYAFLLLSKDTEVTLAVGLGNFLAADDSPWELLMATGLIYALPPAAIYYAFKRYMVAGPPPGAGEGGAGSPGFPCRRRRDLFLSFVGLLHPHLRDPVWL